jgi:hypothetical protein
MASKNIVRLARLAAISHAKAAEANRKWVDAFQDEYGHDDIDDALIDVIDYSSGDVSMLTADFIDEHSIAGKS